MSNSMTTNSSFLGNNIQLHSGDNDLNLAYAAITLFTVLSCFTAILGNSVLVCYYISRRKETAPMLYLLLTMTDLIVGTSAAGVSYVLIRTQLRAGLENTFAGLSPSLFVKMYSFLYFVSCRASVFITCTMCITQTIQVRAVFYQPRYSAILASVLSYYGTLVTISLAYFSIDMVKCEKSYFLCVPVAHPHLMTNVLFYGIPYVLPTLPVLVGGVLTCTTMMRYRSLRKRDKTAITIVTITIIFLVFNLAFLAHYYFHEWIYSDLHHDETALRKDEIFFYTSHTLSHFVNSALNPIILIARNSRFQTYLTNSVKRKITKTLSSTRLLAPAAPPHTPQYCSLSRITVQPPQRATCPTTPFSSRFSLQPNSCFDPPHTFHTSPVLLRVSNIGLMRRVSTILDDCENEVENNRRMSVQTESRA